MEHDLFKRVLVLGADKCGKTSMLSMGVNRTISDEYMHTHRPNSFFAVDRKLEFIDTPGMEDRILNIGYTVNFLGDPFLREVRGMTSADSGEYTPIFDSVSIHNLDAYVIMYAEEKHPPFRTLQTAKAFRLALLDMLQTHKITGRRIYIVKNLGSIPRIRVTGVERDEEHESNKHIKNIWLDEKAFIDEDFKKGVKILPDIRASTGHGIDHMFDIIAAQLHGLENRRVVVEDGAEAETEGDLSILGPNGGKEARTCRIGTDDDGDGGCVIL